MFVILLPLSTFLFGTNLHHRTCMSLIADTIVQLYRIASLFTVAITHGKGITRASALVWDIFRWIGDVPYGESYHHTHRLVATVLRALYDVRLDV